MVEIVKRGSGKMVVEKKGDGMEMSVERGSSDVVNEKSFK